MHASVHLCVSCQVLTGLHFAVCSWLISVLPKFSDEADRAYDVLSTTHDPRLVDMVGLENAAGKVCTNVDRFVWCPWYIQCTYVVCS